MGTVSRTLYSSIVTALVRTSRLRSGSNVRSGSLLYVLLAREPEDDFGVVAIGALSTKT